MEVGESKYLLELGEFLGIFGNVDETPFFVDAELKIGAGDEARELAAPFCGDETADEEPFSVLLLLLLFTVGGVVADFGAGVDDVGGEFVAGASVFTPVFPSLGGSVDFSWASTAGVGDASSVAEFLRLSSGFSSVGVGFNKDKMPPCLDLSPEEDLESSPPTKSEILDCLSLAVSEEFADGGGDNFSEEALVLLELLFAGVPKTIGGATLVLALLLPFKPLLLELLEAQLLCLLLLVSGGVAIESDEIGGIEWKLLLLFALKEDGGTKISPEV